MVDWNFNLNEAPKDEYLLFTLKDGTVTVGQRWWRSDRICKDYLDVYTDGEGIHYEHVEPVAWSYLPEGAKNMADDKRARVQALTRGFSSSDLESSLQMIFDIQVDLIETLWDVQDTLEDILRGEESIKRRSREVKVDLSDLRAQVQQNTQAVESAKTLVNGLANKVDELAAAPTVDPAELQQLAQDLRANSDALSEAVVKNTPSEQ